MTALLPLSGYGQECFSRLALLWRGLEQRFWGKGEKMSIHILIIHKSEHSPKKKKKLEVEGREQETGGLQKYRWVGLTPLFATCWTINHPHSSDFPLLPFCTGNMAGWVGVSFCLVINLVHPQLRMAQQNRLIMQIGLAGSSACFCHFHPQGKKTPNMRMFSFMIMWKLFPFFKFRYLFMGYQKHQWRAVQCRALHIGYFCGQVRQFHDPSCTS